MGSDNRRHPQPLPLHSSTALDDDADSVMSASIVSRPCLAAAAVSRARLVSRAASGAHSSSTTATTGAVARARHHAGRPTPSHSFRGIAQVTRAKKGGFMAEMDEAKAEESGAAVAFTLPLAIQKYPISPYETTTRRSGSSIRSSNRWRRPCLRSCTTPRASAWPRRRLASTTG